MRARAAAKPVKRRASAAQPRKAAAANSTTGPRNASDEAVSRATGKTWKQWFTILDAARASTLDHKGVVAIAAHHGAGAWWQQMVAVEYEQARGLRRKHEKPSGFQISKSVTLAQPIAKVYAGWSDPRARMRWLEESIVIRKETPQKTMRITWSDGTTHVEAYFWNRAPQKCQVTVQHSKLPDEKAAERMKRFWGSALARFARSLN
jgi:uncharacterized protein YndB with AHSA1/START domain